MCTTITVKSKEGSVSGRTMEFAVDLGFVPTFVPRGVVFRKDLLGNDIVTKKAMIGTSIRDGEDYAIMDGVNEDGLMACANYFAGDADYPKEITGTKKVSLRADGFPGYILSHCSTIEEVKEMCKDIELLDLPDAESQPTSLTFHFAFYDKQGKAIIVEPLEKTLKVMDNPVGVMTNSPDFQWHLTNLRNYVHVVPTNKNTNKFGDLDVRRFGEGSGLLGLPGDYTPPSRFVRATHYVNNMPEQATSTDAVTKAFHILSNFDIPYGAIYNPDADACDITHYIAVMDGAKLTYNVANKTDRAIHQIKMSDMDLDGNTVKFFEMPKEQTIVSMK